jgi:hypothetical protein
VAIWQFECSLAPPDAALLPDADEAAGWDRHQPPDGYQAVIASFAPRAASWSGEILMWGEENGDRVEVVLDSGRVADIICRLDLRAFSEPFAQGVLRLAEFCGCRLRNRAGRLFVAEWSALLGEVRASDELRFVRDPRGFLAGLSGKQSPGG